MKKPSQLDHSDAEDRTDLGALYPVPKTYDEKQRELRERRKLLAGRRPKHVVISTGVRLYILLLLVVALVMTAPQLVYGNVISGVFLLFGLGLAFAGIVYWFIGVIAGNFYKTGIDTSRFFMAYTLSATLPLAALLRELTLTENYLLLLTVIGVVHFVFVYLIIKAINTDDTRGSRGESRLIGLVIAGMITALLIVTL